MSMNYKSIVFDIVGVLFEYNIFSQPKFEPIEQGIALLDFFAQQKNVNIYACTNMSNKKLSILRSEHPKYMSLFDAIVTSEDAGAAKPDSQIYEYLFSAYTIDPKKTLYFDDSLENIKAAALVGLYGLHVNDFTRVYQELKRLGFDVSKKR